MVIKLNSKIYIASILILSLLCSLLFYTPKIVFTATSEDVKKEDIVTMPVIMYHHILEENKKDDEFVVTIKQFKNDMDYLEKKGYNTISIEQLIDFVEKDIDLPKNPILITFDDGFLSVYKYAFPILSKKNMKAVALVLGYYTDLFSTDTPRHINYANLSWSELQEMQSSGVFSIGNHSYDLHYAKGKGNRYGSTINKGESKESYKKSVGDDLNKFNKKMMENLGSKCLSFAYPFGAISEELTPFLEEKFKVIFTCDDRVNKLTKDMAFPLVMKRFNRSSKLTTKEFFSKFL